MARAATAGELTNFRKDGQYSKLYAAIYPPTTIYTARVNQTFTTYDGLLEITYDTGSGTLANVLVDMTLFVGSTAGAWDKGICRIRSIDATKVYISETSDISFADNDYLTIVDDFGLYAKHLLISSGTTYMDGGIAYSDQHTNFDPTPIMGPNRVLYLSGSTVSTTFDGSASYVIDGSTIASKTWSSPGSSASSGTTGWTPTFTYNAAGWYKVYLTITATNGKIFWGVRYVYVYSSASMPSSVAIADIQGDAGSGGWEARLVMHDDASLTQVRDHTLVIVFAVDYYGTTQTSIGPITGCENVVLSGWVVKETISMSPDGGLVEFTVSTGHAFLQNIPSYPNGVEFVSGTPAAWTEMKNLTTDLGLWHFLHWRTTATRVMDVILTGDTKYSKEVSSMAGDMWSQINEMAFESILARPLVDRYNRLYIQVHPNLIPTTSRSSIPSVMTITKSDRADVLEFERVTLPEVSTVSGSGVAVDGSGNGTPYFSLSPGHTLSRYGVTETLDNLLVSDQAQANTLTGMYRSWRNNPLPDIPIQFLANNRLIDIAPLQRCYISIASGDNVRGYAYAGHLVPNAVAYLYDDETGYMHTEVSFEAATVEGTSVNGDVPGSDDRSTPPTPSYPPLPDFPVIIPGPVAGISRSVVLHDPDDTGHTGVGIVYTTNFDAASPNWLTGNGGLTQFQYAHVNNIKVCPGGAVYVAYEGGWQRGHNDGHFLAWAPSLGGLFTVLKTESDIETEYAGSGDVLYLGSLACRPDVPETVLYIAGRNIPPFGDTTDVGIYLGSSTSFSKTATITDFRMSGKIPSASYGQSTWSLIYDTVTGAFQQVRYHRYNAGATASSLTSNIGGNDSRQIRAGLSSVIYLLQDGASTQFILSTDNGSTWNWLPSTNDMGAGAAGLAMDDTGQCAMARWSTGSKGKSSDYGTTWTALSSLPAGNTYYWGYMGGVGSASQWVAAGPTGVVRYSPDFGTTWENKEGDFAALGTHLINIVVPIRTVTP